MRKRGAACWKDWRAPDCPADTASGWSVRGAGGLRPPPGTRARRPAAWACRGAGPAPAARRCGAPGARPARRSRCRRSARGQPSRVAPEWLRAGAHARRSASLPTFPRADITSFGFSDREGRIANLRAVGMTTHRPHDAAAVVNASWQVAARRTGPPMWDHGDDLVQYSIQKLPRQVRPSGAAPRRLTSLNLAAPMVASGRGSPSRRQAAPSPAGSARGSPGPAP